MARVLGATLGGEEGAVFNVSGGLFLLCVIVAWLSIMSMVIFGCGDDDDDSSNSTHGHGPKDSGGPPAAAYHDTHSVAPIASAAGAAVNWGPSGGVVPLSSRLELILLRQPESILPRSRQTFPLYISSMHPFNTPNDPLIPHDEYPTIRMLSNRESARHSRRRKEAHLSELEQQRSHFYQAKILSGPESTDCS
ncbi:hypothetical protein MRB53_032314 [Persea americana]|uniref:Uncharacterized protein n=1 Tax=Persea americana TaxID=3435 RepID=A0ACC2KRH0_PERAE|nr:hypothetical protein MRB53_032314 [Persea americana]